MPTTRLKEFLKDNRVAYQVVLHPEAFTVKLVAGTAHFPRRQMAMSSLGDSYLRSLGWPVIHVSAIPTFKDERSK
jgi:hypothetical protein